MRTRTWLVLVPVFAAAAGLVAVGCGDDTTMATGTDSGPTEGGGGQDATKPDTSTGGDAAKETGADAAKEAAACMDASINVATFDSGSPVWACYQQNCDKDDAGNPGSLAQCAADCTCNSAFAAALNCIATDAGTSSTCFGTAIMGTLGAAWLSNCFTPYMGVCGAAGTTMTDAGDAAPDEGAEGGGEGGGDGGTDAGDGAAD